MNLTDLLYPRRCPVCLDALKSGEDDICPCCRKKVRLVTGPTCYKCGKPLQDETREYCSSCQKRKPPFTEGIAWAEYSSLYIRRLMAEVKYRGNCQLLDYPCRDFAISYREKVLEWNPEVLIPVPVHLSRYRIRGYNQAEEIAKRLSVIWDIPVDSAYLMRREKTKAQKELSSDERLRNLLDAFAVAGKRGKYSRVLLVDDIYTTGATVSACTRLLQDAGVSDVFIAVLCTGRDDSVAY